MRRILGALCLLVASGAQAAPACYVGGEIEADQAVQYQTELMVMSGACGTHNYTDFLQRNSSIISTYQSTLIEHYRRGGRNPEQTFESYLTHLANQSSLRLGEQTPAALCAQSADWLKAADTLGPEEFRRLVASRATVRKTAYRRCGG
jgi:hypothetical protein